MLVHFEQFRPVAGIGHQAPGEIQGVAVFVRYHLYRGRVVIFPFLHGGLHGGHLQIWFFHKGICQPVDDLRRDHRFVPLHVYYYIRIRIFFRYFRQPAGSVRMILPGHAGAAAEGNHCIVNPAVVCGHDHFRRTGRFFGLLIHPLYHGLSPDQLQGFSRQAGRCVPGRNYTDYFHIRSLLISISSLQCAVFSGQT